MKQVLWGLFLLAAGFSLAQGTDYRQAAAAAAALARLQTVAQGASGEERLLGWAQGLKARAETSYGERAYFRAAREAQAALLLFRAARGEPEARAQPPARPAPRMGLGPGRGQGRFAPGRRPRAELAPRLAEGARRAVDRVERELVYYRGQDPLIQDLIAEAKGRLEGEPGRALLLSRAALALISAERGF
ncbi:hypothetical protein [Thermus thermamylovorans]|uniref:DUF4398 domain-containing protein n=1 Tax=Thermus thermamylovorans TaxID=2509362 RepID=A0A4Q9B0E2_9DEIN|nr:hypothetical protein [Thermus thermamylovorans]TBH17618.1 hypothetical protein ETP66_08525 [Thermus thermamylovorans]